jgi:hypothetical protein
MVHGRTWFGLTNHHSQYKLTNFLQAAATSLILLRAEAKKGAGVASYVVYRVLHSMVLPLRDNQQAIDEFCLLGHKNAPKDCTPRMLAFSNGWARAVRKSFAKAQQAFCWTDDEGIVRALMDFDAETVRVLVYACVCVCVFLLLCSTLFLYSAFIIRRSSWEFLGVTCPLWSQQLRIISCSHTRTIQISVMLRA